MIFRKPTAKNLTEIYRILGQWNKPPYLDELFALVKTELSHKLDYNMQFFVLADAAKVIGVGGITEMNPAMREFATRQKTGSIKSLYLDNASRGKGFGRALLLELEKELRSQGYEEIVLRSAIEFQPTAWDFYIKMGYTRSGSMLSSDGKSEMAVFQKIL